MIGSMTVVGRITWKYLNRARRLMNSDCTHPDGGVKFTGFVAPTEISPGLIETRRFTFRDQRIFEAFVMANADKAFRVADADDWNTP